MSAKIETKRLQYLRLNQTRLQAEVYFELKDAILADGEPNQIRELFYYLLLLVALGKCINVNKIL